MTPQTILILLCAAEAVLLLIRLSIGGSGRRLRSPDVGSSMTIGGREVQEDFVGTLATQTGLVAVLADGMGKAYGARIASRTAVETFLDLFRDYNAFDNPQYYFRKSFHAANRAILRELGDEGYGAASVGVAMIRENWLFYAVVGNVKLCVFRNGDLVPVSAGHTLDVLAEQSFRTGRLSREDALVMLENHRLYNYLGQDSFKGSGPDMTGIAMPGMLPLGGDAAIAASSDKDHGSIWYGGIAADVTYFEPFRFALDAAYGSVDMGTSKYKDKNFDVKRSGWYAAFLAEYKLESCTPGLLFWYSSGDDANAYNGSERLPSIDPDVYVTSYGFDGTNYGGAAQTLGYGISGTWAVMARVKDISFMEDLSHVLRVVYYQGTNNKEMVRSKMISNPQDSVASMMYLTTGDKAVEVNFDTEYKLYKNLSLFVELGYIRLDLDKDLWKGVGYEAKENNFKGTFSIGYKF